MGENDADNSRECLCMKQDHEVSEVEGRKTFGMGQKDRAHPERLYLPRSRIERDYSRSDSCCVSKDTLRS